MCTNLALKTHPRRLVGIYDKHVIFQYALITYSPRIEMIK